MTLAQALAGFAVVALLLTLAPGLDLAIVLRQSLTRGRGHAVATILGIQCGLLAWGAAAGAGATAVLAASQGAYRVLSAGGAVYLAWMGAVMLRRAWRPQPAPARRGPGAPQRGGLWRAWLTGVATDLLNPKAGVFYLATIPQFMADGVSPLVMGVLLAGVHVALCGAWFGLVALGASRLGERLRSPRVMRAVDGLTGGVLVAFGVRLALDARA
ncbi:LysE family translocator [Actinomyces slackii]|uniref:Threonine efflux protein n=1 Tax=Actinomyces slackii TaxID=52774 RepID=A0A3S4U380_9ACTO|nr:LysE family translocator [Actinomyces slackii]VEG75393.1 Threonine efflux protein [Actinomyces slackii]